MHAKLRRLLLAVIAFEAVGGATALLALQGPWRTTQRPSQSPAMVRLISEQLAEEPLVSVHPFTQRTLDRVARLDGIRFAAIVDSAGKTIRSSGQAPGGLRPDPSRGGVPAILKSVPTENLQVFQAPLAKELGQPRWLLVAIRDTASERAGLDGTLSLGAALLAGLVFNAVIVLPRFRGWTAGLHELHTAIRRLASGAAPKPVAPAGNDEVAYLSLAFNDMAGRISAGRKALTEANQRLERRVAERTEELRVANQTLERQNVELERVTETALRFTDDVAHEFRTPLTVVSEFASLLNDGLGGPITPKQTEYLRFITDATRDLACLVDDFLDSSKLRARSLRVDRREHSVKHILDAVWPMLQARAVSAGVTLERDVDPATPLVYADKEKAARTLVNLTINALKFSGTGTKVTVRAGPSDRGGARIAVTDQGVGLTEPEVARLFERFRQTATGRTTASKGFGLGLCIVRELVQLNLGAITITSTPGTGSTFAFELPPNDAGTIVDLLLDRVRQQEDGHTIGLLRVIPSKGGVTDELRCSLAAVAYPLDVQLVAPDGRALLLVGVTSDAERWRDRLVSELAHPEHADDRTAALCIDMAMTMSRPEARERILAVLAEPILTMEALAT